MTEQCLSQVIWGAGMDIAAELAQSGVARTLLSCRQQVHVVPRYIFGKPADAQLKPWCAPLACSYRSSHQQNVSGRHFCSSCCSGGMHGAGPFALKNLGKGHIGPEPCLQAGSHGTQEGAGIWGDHHDPPLARQPEELQLPSAQVWAAQGEHEPAPVLCGGAATCQALYCNPCKILLPQRRPFMSSDLKGWGICTFGCQEARANCGILAKSLGGHRELRSCETVTSGCRYIRQ